MATIRPFAALRPARHLTPEVASLPYDVFSRAEARAAVQGRPLSFLNIDRPETQFPEDADMYAPEVYERAAAMLREQERQGIFLQDETPGYYIYELTWNGRAQTGLVALSSVDDYEAGVVKRHENTRAEKEADRIRHVDATSAQTGPIFLTYRAREEIGRILSEKKSEESLFDFTAEGAVRHRGWAIRRKRDIQELTRLFAEVPRTYIADGHHRAASAVAVSRMRREKKPDYTGEEEFNFFLSVLFPDDELTILDYNRVLRDWNNLSKEELLAGIGLAYEVGTAQEKPAAPQKKGEAALFLDGMWVPLRSLSAREKTDPVGALDVDYLQREVLEPVWGIEDPRTDDRIDFVGGIRGLAELERRCEKDGRAAFALYPTSIEELLAVADADLLMPPKSTWFEPKLASGLFIHKIEE